jgi:hypothetical protein
MSHRFSPENSKENQHLSSIMRENGNFSPKTLGNIGWDLAVYLQIREN